jgi:hypothetical protein
MMSRTALIAHMHGGNLFHSIGMPDDSIVIELIPSTGSCTTGYQFNMCLKHRYFHVPVIGDREVTKQTKQTNMTKKCWFC